MRIGLQAFDRGQNQAQIDRRRFFFELQEAIERVADHEQALLFRDGLLLGQFGFILSPIRVGELFDLLRCLAKIGRQQIGWRDFEQFAQHGQRFGIPLNRETRRRVKAGKNCASSVNCSSRAVTAGSVNGPGEMPRARGSRLLRAATRRAVLHERQLRAPTA